MKTPFNTYGSLHRVLVLVAAVLLLFIGMSHANPLEELKDIFTKDRSKPPAETDPPLHETIPNFVQSTTPGGLTKCRHRHLLQIQISEHGDITYIVDVVDPLINKYVTRLAGNITTPLGQAMLHMLLAPPTPGSDHLQTGAFYPAGYNCSQTNLTVPAKHLYIKRRRVS